MSKTCQKHVKNILKTCKKYFKNTSKSLRM